jgi:glutamate/tyrosine decarboxylase-like PLP-dependent enzyme
MQFNYQDILARESGLDPEDWSDFRAKARQMLEDALDFMEGIPQRPVWQPIPDEVKQQLYQPLPEIGEGLDKTYQDFLSYIFPYPKGSIHPRFWSWVEGTGSPSAVMADFFAAVMNSNLGIGEHSAVYVENQVIDWLKQAIGFSQEGFGLLVSGGTMANFTGLTVARNHLANAMIRKQGLRALEGQLVLYGSVETHSCVQKTIELLGLGNDAIRKIPIDDQYRIVPEKLREAIRQDRSAGYIPFCIIGNAGTVNTGVIDDLNELAKICQEENLWFHIDGAFGGLVALLPEFEEVRQGVAQSDSIAFDLHKWMYMPYEIGCVLIKDKKLHREAFAVPTNYLLAHEAGLASGLDPFSNYGLQLSRGFRALKAWFLLKEHGIDKYRQLIRQNIAQTYYLADLVKMHPQLELLAPIETCITCFRYVDKNLSDEQLNELNKKILIELQVRGIAAPSYTLLQGKYAIRAANTNQRSRKADFDILVKAVVDLGNELKNL